MIAAPSSSSGKTTLTCALLALLKNRGRSPVAFKCGPDFIDPMFHERVLGVPSTNLDSYFVGEDEVREIFSEEILRQAQNDNESRADCAVIEGVMGLGGEVTSGFKLRHRPNHRNADSARTGCERGKPFDCAARAGIFGL